MTNASVNQTEVTGSDAKARPPKSARSARRRSREFALQGLYRWQLNAQDPTIVAAEVGELEEFDQADLKHFRTLFYGVIADVEDLRAQVSPHLDRPIIELSPIEHNILLLGAYEFTHHLEIPYRVVINEGVELAKSFGGTDGFKYINGVLDKLAAVARAIEVGKKG